MKHKTTLTSDTDFIEMGVKVGDFVTVKNKTFSVIKIIDGKNLDIYPLGFFSVLRFKVLLKYVAAKHCLRSAYSKLRYSRNSTARKGRRHEK